MSIQNAYAWQTIKHRQPFDTKIKMPELTIFASKYIPGGEPGERANLETLLTEQWPGDLHFSQYNSTQNTRLTTKEAKNEGIRFEMAVFDLDNHEKKPSLEDFDNLCRIVNLIDDQPNIIYKTRGGARLIYLIKPITDPNLFEEHWAGLRTKLKIIENCNTPYKVDMFVKDWTRLFRSNWVMREDERGNAFSTNHEPNYFCHDCLYNLEKFAAVKKPVFKPSPFRKLNHDSPEILKAAEKYIRTVAGAVAGNGGHKQTFKVCCMLLDRYMLSVDQARPLAELHNTRCDPPWSQKDLEHKLRDAASAVGKEYTTF